MRIGLALPQFDFSVPGEWPLQWDTVLGWARRAEALGFESLWLADHLFFDLSRHGGPARLAGVFDPLPALGGLARGTSRARIGTLVLCAPLRPPGVVASALATADVLSGGRVVAGVGAGWYEPEFLAAGVPFRPPAARLTHLAEYVTVLRAMFGGSPVTFSGEYVSVVDAPRLPRPVQIPPPPIWIGGRGTALLTVVARVADGWNTAWTSTPQSFRERAEVLDRACERVGRDPSTVTRSVGLAALVGEHDDDLRGRFERLAELSPPGLLQGTTLDEWCRGRLVGTVEQVREQLETWAAVGVDELIVTMGAVPFAVGADDDLEIVAAACSLEAP